MPIVVTILTTASERPGLVRSGWNDIGRVVFTALVLDTTYQLLVLRWIYPVQLVIVAVACAIVPYVLVRGPVNRLSRALHRNRPAGSGR